MTSHHFCSLAQLRSTTSPLPSNCAICQLASLVCQQSQVKELLCVLPELPEEFLFAAELSEGKQEVVVLDNWSIAPFRSVYHPACPDWLLFLSIVRTSICADDFPHANKNNQNAWTAINDFLCDIVCRFNPIKCCLETRSPPANYTVPSLSKLWNSIHQTMKNGLKISRFVVLDFDY